MFWQQFRQDQANHPHGRHGQHGHHGRHDHNHMHPLCAFGDRGDRGGRGGGPRGRHGRRPGGDEGPGGWFSGEPPRADRGGVRYLVLDAIAKQPRHGYEIIQAISDKSKETYKPSPGVIYPTLQMLEELGHAKNTETEGRKAFTITEAGLAELAGHQEYVDDFYERAGDNPFDRFAEDFGAIRGRIHLLMKTFQRAMRRGEVSSKALGEVVKVLDEAVVKIQGIFSERKKD